ncbi:4Fe-4S binding protein [Chloroflexota bacterium]
MVFKIDRSECNRCGSCIEVCPKRAITMHSGSAIINEDLCNQCGACADVCPADAIREVVLANVKLPKGGETMQYGYGRGFGGGLGRRGGAGFGFRGGSPPWPYSGIGRGGLPRCCYPGAAISSHYPPVQPLNASKMTREGEIDWLKSQAEVIRAELNQVEARIQDLGAGK